MWQLNRNLISLRHGKIACAIANVNIHFEAACDRDTAHVLFLRIFLVALNVGESVHKQSNTYVRTRSLGLHPTTHTCRTRCVYAN